MRPLIVFVLMIGAFASLASPSSAAQEATPPIRYLDVTTSSEGWAIAQAAAASASRNKGVVVVTYLDPQETRALYDEAVRFINQWEEPRVVGVIRSLAAPAHMKATPNPLGFDVFFDGVALPPMEQPDPRFTRTEQLDAALRSIRRNHFATENGCFDIEREPDPATGGLRIPKQRVCPPGKLQSPRTSESSQGER